MHSTSPLKNVFALEIPVSENDRALRGQRDQAIKSPIATPTRGLPRLAEKRQREDFVTENANQAKLDERFERHG
jgi:hypothetical protein